MDASEHLVVERTPQPCRLDLEIHMKFLGMLVLKTLPDV